MLAQFGGFLLINKLGSGGMGVIYHAVDKELGRQVALKVMKKSLGDDAEFVQSFKHEAQAAAALNHRNVVQIYSFGPGQGPALYRDGTGGRRRLDEMIAGGQQMPEDRALDIHLEVTEGLKAASDVGLIHSDIKPANILFGQSGEAKVVDFGLASFIGQQQQGGQIWGTPYYIAPEKARGKKVDFRSDIYSLGATLFHALAGQPPFDGATPTDVVLARLNNPAPSLRDFRDDIHPETVALVARMLEPDPSMRYPSYPALLLDMRAAQPRDPAQEKQGKQVGRHENHVLRASGVRPARFPQIHQKSRAAAAVAALILLAGGASGWIWHQKKQARLAEELAAKQRSGSSGAGRRSRMGTHWRADAAYCPQCRRDGGTGSENLDSGAGHHGPSSFGYAGGDAMDRYQEQFNEAKIFSPWLLSASRICLKKMRLRNPRPGPSIRTKPKPAPPSWEDIADQLALIYQMIDIPWETVQQQVKEMGVPQSFADGGTSGWQRAAEAEACRRAELEAKKESRGGSARSGKTPPDYLAAGI